jgi:hypothetical protein
MGRRERQEENEISSRGFRDEDTTQAKSIQKAKCDFIVPTSPPVSSEKRMLFLQNFAVHISIRLATFPRLQLNGRKWHEIKRNKVE